FSEQNRQEPKSPTSFGPPLDHVIGVRIPASQPLHSAFGLVRDWSAAFGVARRFASLIASGTESLPPSHFSFKKLVSFPGLDDSPRSDRVFVSSGLYPEFVHREHHASARAQTQPEDVRSPHF